MLAALWLAIAVSWASAAAVVNTIPIGNNPERVSSDGTPVWVANDNGDTVSEIQISAVTPTRLAPGTMLRDYALHLVFWTPPSTTLPSDVEPGMEQMESDIKAALAAGQDGNIYAVPGDYTDASGPGDPRIASIDTTNDSDAVPANQAGTPCGAPAPCVTPAQVNQEVSSLGAEKGWTPGYHTLVLVVLASPINVCVTQTCDASTYHSGTADGYTYALIPMQDDLSYATGHEQNEAIVDPSGGRPEIADPCEGRGFGANEINGHVYAVPYLLLPSGVCSQIVAARLLQGSPTSSTVEDGAGFRGQLTVTNASGAMTYATERASPPDYADVVVSSSGAVTAARTLAPGVYTVSGVASDMWGDNGAWKFKLTVSERCAVPKLTGRTLAAAKTALKRADCAVGKITKRTSSTVSTGRVISSSPKAGSKHKAGTKVALTVSRRKP